MEGKVHVDRSTGSCSGAALPQRERSTFLHLIIARLNLDYMEVRTPVFVNDVPFKGPKHLFDADPQPRVQFR